MDFAIYFQNRLAASQSSLRLTTQHTPLSIFIQSKQVRDLQRRTQGVAFTLLVLIDRKSIQHKTDHSCNVRQQFRTSPKLGRKDVGYSSSEVSLLLSVCAPLFVYFESLPHDSCAALSCSTHSQLLSILWRLAVNHTTEASCIHPRPSRGPQTISLLSKKIPFTEVHLENFPSQQSPKQITKRLLLQPGTDFASICMFHIGDLGNVTA